MQNYAPIPGGCQSCKPGRVKALLSLGSGFLVLGFTGFFWFRVRVQGTRVPSFVIAPRFYLTASVLFYFLSDTLGELTEGLKSSAQGTGSFSGMNDPGLVEVR